MSKIAIITDIVGIIVSVLIIKFVSDWNKNMDDSPNVQQGVSEEKTCKDIYYCSESSDEEEEGHNDYHDNSIWENSVKFSDSDDSTDNERDEFTLDDFCNKWQRQPCTSMEICEYEDDERRVGLRSGPLNKQEPLFQSEETDSKSSDDGDYDDYWKHVRKSKDWRCDDYWKYEPKEKQKKVTESKQPTFLL